MEESGYTSIFISYSHSDTQWMMRFRQELKGALFNRADVWCDADIGAGNDWLDRLGVELDRAKVALVLASPDYLESTWCRRELEYVDSKFRGKRLEHVFWVEVRPCAWRHTDLARFQRSGSGSARKAVALSEIADESARDREIIRIVEDICEAVKGIAAKQDPMLRYVESVLGEEAFQRHIHIESVISNDGDFSVVCRGRDANQQDVAIKVMRRSPISGILENQLTAAQRRTNLRDPGFIHLYESFLVKNVYGDHLVLISEYFKGDRLRDALKKKSLRHNFNIDNAVTLIRRAAEALQDLHEVESAASESGGREILGFGPMIPDHLFYDARLDRVRFSAFSISNFAWDVLGWRKFAALIKPEYEHYAAPEQREVKLAVAKLDKRKVDQYMLGRLAMELLDAGSGGAGEGSGSRHADAAAMADPLALAGAWKRAHQQLAAIIGRMLARDQKDRFSSMEEIVRQMKAVESASRALAKASYVRWIDNDREFFEEFYRLFFRAAGAAARGRFANPAQQHSSLRKGMAAVLNFSPGNHPNSLRYVVEAHRNKGVTEKELVQFQGTFLKLLADRMDRDVKPDDAMAGRKDDILDAWRDLFAEVLAYFREQDIKA